MDDNLNNVVIGVVKDVDYLKKAVHEIQESDKVQTDILSDMKTSILLIETNMKNIVSMFNSIGKTLAWASAGLGILISVAVILNLIK